MQKKLLALGAIATIVQILPAQAGFFGPALSAPWNSAENRSKIEKGIKENWHLQTTGAAISVSSASCKASSTKNIWICVLRPLGNPQSIKYRIEVDPESGKMAGKPIP